MIPQALVPTHLQTAFIVMFRGSYIEGSASFSILDRSQADAEALYDRSDNAGTCPKNRDRFSVTNAMGVTPGQEDHRVLINDWTWYFIDSSTCDGEHEEPGVPLLRAGCVSTPGRRRPVCLARDSSFTWIRR